MANVRSTITFVGDDLAELRWPVWELENLGMAVEMDPVMRKCAQFAAIRQGLIED